MGRDRGTGQFRRDTGIAGKTESTGIAGSDTTGNTGSSTGGAGEGARVETVDRLTPPDILAAEAAAAMATAPVMPEIPGTAAVPATPDPATMEAGYAAIGEAVLGAACNAMCPAWDVTDAEKSKLAGALAHAMQLWFPGEIPEKYVALIVVAGVGFEIVSARRDPATGGLKPRFHAAPASAEQH